MADAVLVVPITLAKIDAITLDVSVSEQHTGEVQVTEHNIENGSSIADHARPMPNKLTIEGIISNTPINRTAVLRIVNSLGIPVSTITQEDQNQGQAGYAEQAAALLENLRTNPRLITVTTALRTYENMIMTSLSIPRNASIGEAVRFTAAFQAFKLVTNRIDTVKVAKIPQGNKKKSLGKQPAQEPSDAEQKSKTWLLEISDRSGATEAIFGKK